MQNFSELGLSEEILKAVSDLGFEKPSPIQEKVIPILLESDTDLIATAQTGTGKTAAFGLPIISNLDTNSKNIQAFILSPTRELCLQITRDLETYAKYTKGVSVLAVYGGASIETQISALKRGCQIVVATPGRAKDLILRKKLNLENTQKLILDEADEMLSMGFKEDLDFIFAQLPKDKQTLLFSATMSREVKNLSKTILSNPLHLEAEKVNSGAKNISHIYYQVPSRQRYSVLKRVVDLEPNIYAIIFCRTRRETKEVADKLSADSYMVDTLHGEMSQAQRDDVMQKFRSGRLKLLVATDVAARGLDVNELTHVINYNLPDDSEVYTHRSGRTGRAGNKGVSVVIIHSKEYNKVRQIEKTSGITFEKKEVPSGEDICKNQLFAMIDQIEKVEPKIDKIAPFIDEINKRFSNLTKEEIIQKIVFMRFNEMLSYYKNANDIQSESDDSRGGGGRGDRENFQRFFINVGKDDRLNPARLLGVINDALGSKKAQVGQIEVLKSFSFFEIEKDVADDILRNMNGDSFEGKKLSVEISEKSKKSGGDRKNFKGGGDRKGYGGGGDKGGFKKKRRRF